MSSPLSIGEVARRLGVSVATVRRMEGRQQLVPIRTEGRHRRYDEAQVAALIRSPGGPPSQDSRIPPGPSPFGGTNEFSSMLPEEHPEPPQAGLAPELGAIEGRTRRMLDEVRESLQTLVQKTQKSVEEKEESSRRTKAELDQLKSYGRILIPFGVPDRWRARVIRRIEEVFTPQRFPPGLPYHERITLVRAEIEEALEGFRTEQDKEFNARLDAQRCKGLCKTGERYAAGQTLDLPFSESHPLMHDIKEALSSDVKPDWTEEDVEALVDDVLEDWEEDQGPC